jgi:hypothetical protein
MGVPLVLGILSIRDLFRFWYMIYGATNYDEITSTPAVGIGLATLHILFVVGLIRLG